RGFCALARGPDPPQLRLDRPEERRRPDPDRARNRPAERARPPDAPNSVGRPAAVRSGADRPLVFQLGDPDGGAFALSSDWRTKPPQYFPSFVLGVLSVSMMAFLAPVPASADESVPPILRDVGFVNHLGARLPLNQTFRDERGQLVRLGDYVRGKPVVLTLND